MDPRVSAAVIGVAGAIIGAFLNAWLLHWQPFSRRPKHDVRGQWKSSWGPLPKGPVNHSGLLTVEEQRDSYIKGTISVPDTPNRKWHCEGRCDGTFFQIVYFPAPDSKDGDFVDYGSFFLRRRANGVYSGFSTGFGELEDADAEGIVTDYHELRRT